MNYNERIARALTTTPNLFPRGINTLNIAHDKWCGIYQDQVCTCTPDIETNADGKRIVIDEEGHVFVEPDVFTCIPDKKLRAGAMHCFMSAMADLLKKEGLRAFEMPRIAAIAHEAGHAIVDTHDDRRVVSVKIESKTFFGVRAWGGFCETRKGWDIGPKTSPEHDFKIACCVIAGLCAEQLTNTMHLGSSLDEVILAQLLTASAAQKLKIPELELWATVHARTMCILRWNEGVTQELMARLDKTGTIRGTSLQSILRKVRQLPDEFTEADIMPGQLAVAQEMLRRARAIDTRDQKD